MSPAGDKPAKVDITCGDPLTDKIAALFQGDVREGPWPEAVKFAPLDWRHLTPTLKPCPIEPQKPTPKTPRQEGLFGQE